MNLQEYRKIQNEEKQRGIYDWWKNNGEDAQETANYFGISLTYVYKIIRRFFDTEKL